jgi:hypothetical protein
MKVTGALVKEQGVEFAIVSVQRRAVLSHTSAAKAIRQLGHVFGNRPAVLMAQDHNGTPTWHGRRDLVRFLRNVSVRAIPWRQYTIN